jgi:dTDP-3-amino-2,3,6-trideoxy-4-keto-D-glucose/dTDP-3-amino-3,4,6-trideoxy-alpha-D-glucose/dTDP-2,6-dideoxy-D-kanosamine transaminase
MQVPFNDVKRSLLKNEKSKKEAISRVFGAGVFFFGEETRAFQSELAVYLGADHVIPVANGTDALEIALLSVGVRRGDTVVTVANAGGYSTAAILKCGASPAYVDISAEDLQVDVSNLHKVLEACEKLPAAVVVTHLYGFMAPVKKILEICKAYSIPIVEDCAQSIGVREHGVHVGNFGDIATLSFYPTKNLGGAGDSGAVFTSSAEYAERAKRLSQYGWGEKYHAELTGGRNSRMDEVQAALLRIDLRELEDRNARRRAVFDFICTRAAHLRFPHRGASAFNAHLAIVSTAGRDELRKHLSSHGIETAIHYPVPDHRQTAWRSMDVSLPVTETESESILSIPAFPELEVNELDHIVETLGGWRL